MAIKITKESNKTKQKKQNDQNGKFYTLAEKINFKQSGLLPLSINEHNQILRSKTLSNFSVEQSIKSIMNA